MSPLEKIRTLIQEGKVPEEEGVKLLEAFGEAEARDRLIREELACARTTRRGSRLWMIFSAGALLLAGGWLVIAAMAPGFSQPPTHQAQAATHLRGRDLDLAIETLEHRLRRPGNATDYRTLGMAYEERYAQSKNEADRQRATAAFTRAEQLERRMPMQRNPGIFGLFFVLVVITAIVMWVMLMYNGLTKADERVNERWAQVEAVLQRRLDLIPQLVETVKGYAVHERQTLLDVTEARAKALGTLQGTGGDIPRSPNSVAQLSQAQADLSQTLKKLLILAEQYPDLKASTSFVTLQDQLEGTENRITVERQRYNDAVRSYNAKMRVFPSNVVGGMFGYEPREYFESKVGAEEPVAVKF